jgi:hypothetical protein
MVVGFMLVLALSFGLSGSLPGVARANGTEQSILMDDYAFIYSSPAVVEQNLEQVASLGVTTVKVSMVWSLVAPDPDATSEPDFDATDPADYPAGAWNRYDTLVEDASRLGLRVYFQITAPAPLWATTSGATGHAHDWSHGVSASELGQFVKAVGDRYSGSYPVAGDGDTQTGTTTTTTATTTTTTPGDGLLGTLGGSPDPGSSSTPDSGTLPAVTEWGIWNEPNELGWLSPQTKTIGGRTVSESPQVYRQFVNVADTSLQATGHGLDTILIGETASGGELAFVQALYCVNSRDVPLTGTAAAADGCPADPGTFVQDNPGLFSASGYAVHPYGFTIPPNESYRRVPGTITMARLGVITSGLDRIDSAYSQPTGMPLYITEWGYKTNPPNPTVTTTLAQQETWLDEGWYMSYAMPRVKAMAQELLYDQPPVAGTAPGTAAYWANFDSGLEYENGEPKPSYDAFRLPLWLPSQRHGDHVRLWAEIRPAAVGQDNAAELQYQAPGRSSWTDVQSLTSGDPDGFISTSVSLPRPGTIRLAWTDNVTETTNYSRTVKIS